MTSSRICRMPDATGGFTDEVEKRKAVVRFTDEAKRKLTEEEMRELEAVLKEDPRPAYQDSSDREYVFGFAGKQVHFRVAEETKSPKMSWKSSKRTIIDENIKQKLSKVKNKQFLHSKN